MKRILSLKIFPIVFLVFSLFLFSQEALAQEPYKGLVPCGGKTDPCTLCHLIIMANGLFNFGLNILVTVALLGIAIGGVMYILAAGNEAAITRAKGFLWAAVGGFAIVLAAWLIVFITMRFLSAKDDLGIEKTNWNTFDCDTKSSAPTDYKAGGGAGGGGGGSW